MIRAAASALFFVSLSAAAQTRSYNSLTTGNGFGFQVFDSNQNKITQFLEHPYRYLKKNPSNPNGPGLMRRNLAYDVYFGVRGQWLNSPTSAGDPEYLDQSHIIRVPAKAGAIAVESYYFAPFDFPGNAMIALLHAPGASDGFLLLNFHMGNAANPEAPDAASESVRYLSAQNAVVETGPGGGFMVYVPLSTTAHLDCAGVYAKVMSGGDLADNTSCSGNDVVPGFQARLGADGWMAAAVAFVDSSNPADADAAAAALLAWQKGRTPDQLLADARSEHERWRKAPPAAAPLCSDDERRLWRSSESVLRMAQVREPNTQGRVNHGMILASLPPGQWHIGWVRDGAYATVALARSGHTDEAKASLDFFMNAGPVGGYKSYVNNQSYRISLTRYFGSGEEECDWSSAGPNTEMDGWGLVLWAARQYVDASGDTAWLSSSTVNGAVYDILSGQVAAPLEANLESSSAVRPDSSIWEVHQPGKHYAYTTMAAARGFCDLGALAQRAGKTADASRYAMLSQKVSSALGALFLDGTMALVGSLEGLQQKRYFDGAVAEAFNFSLVDPLSAIASATLTLFNHLRVDSGGFCRNDDQLSSYDSNEWIFIDLRIQAALRRAGRAAEADRYLGNVVDKAARNFYLLPELYNDVAADGPIGSYAGAVPMVGFGHGAYLLAMLDRGGAWEASDCGDGVRKAGPSFACPSSAGDAGFSSDLGGAPADLAGASDLGSSSPPPKRSGGCACSLGADRVAPGVWPLFALSWLLFGVRLCSPSRCR